MADTARARRLAKRIVASLPPRSSTRSRIRGWPW